MPNANQHLTLTERELTDLNRELEFAAAARLALKQAADLMAECLVIIEQRSFAPLYAQSALLTGSELQRVIEYLRGLLQANPLRLPQVEGEEPEGTT